MTERRKSSTTTRKLKDKLSAGAMQSGLCGVAYEGPSVPDAHGVRCNLRRGHDRGPPHGSARHWGAFKGIPLGWWTPEQKAARDAEKARP